MYILGHLGITSAGVRLVDRRADLRPAMLLAMLPDLIDKPVRLLFPYLVNRNTRGFGHTLVGSLAVLAVLVALRRRGARPLLLWACFLGHFLLDRLWLNDDPRVLFWPLLGGFPPPVSSLELSRPLWRYNLCGEAVGLCLLLALYALRKSRRPAPAA